MQDIRRRRQFHGPPVRRFARVPGACFVAQNAQPGKVVGRGLRMRLQERLQPVDRFLPPVHFAQAPAPAPVAPRPIPENAPQPGGRLPTPHPDTRDPGKPSPARSARGYSPHRPQPSLAGRAAGSRRLRHPRRFGSGGPIRSAPRPEAPARHGRALTLVSWTQDAASNGSAASISFHLMSQSFSTSSSSPTAVPVCFTVPAGSSRTECADKAGREPPRRNRMPDFFHFPPLIQVDQVDRKFHEKGVHRFAGNDPQPFAGLQPLVFQQAGPPFRAGIRHIGSLSQNGLAGLVPHQYFQF